MDMIGKVKRMRFRDHLSFSDIARRTALSRNTVKKWVKAPAEVEPRYRREATAGKLSAFHDTLVLMLRADARRAKHERRTARALHAQIKEQGYQGGYSRLTDFIRAWRQGEGQGAATRAFVPLAFELGEAFQFDWSEEGLVIAGVYRRMQVSHLKLCSSRAFWLVAYPSQGHEMLFDAHTRSFAALGGVARRGIYDNMKTAVDKVKKGKGRVSTPGSPSCARTTCSMPTSATLPVAGRRVSSRRTSKTAGAASGSRPASGASVRSPNSTRGLATGVVRCGTRCAIPSTASSAWPRCLSTSGLT